MGSPLANLLINILAGGMLVTGIFVAGRPRVRPLLRMFALQSFFLAAIAFIAALTLHNSHLMISAGLIILIKVVFIPMFLIRIISKSGAPERLQFVIKPTGSMFMAIAMAIFAFYISLSLIPGLDAVNYFVVSTSVSLVFIGFLMLMIRRGLYGQIVGFLLLENGIFTFGLALTGGMPLLVEIGIFFDVTIGAVLMALLSYRVQKEYKSADTHPLRELTD